jgi:hypothetical protein
VTHDVGQSDVDLAAPNAFDDMQVGSTNAGAADPHHHIRRARNFRICYIFVFDELFCRQLLIKCMENRGFHLFVSPLKNFIRDDGVQAAFAKELSKGHAKPITG